MSLSVEALVEATVERARATIAGTTFTTATVVEWIMEGRAGQVAYDVDLGTSAGTSLAPNGLPVPLRPGTRVMVALTPPHGALIVGHLSPVRAPQVEAARGPAANPVSGALTQLLLGNVTGDLDMIASAGNGYLQVTEAGEYHIETSVEFGSSPDGQRYVELYTVAPDGTNPVGRPLWDARPSATSTTWASGVMSIDLRAKDLLAVRALYSLFGSLNITCNRLRVRRAGSGALLIPGQ